MHYVGNMSPAMRFTVLLDHPAQLLDRLETCDPRAYIVLGNELENKQISYGWPLCVAPVNVHTKRLSRYRAHQMRHVIQDYTARGSSWDRLGGRIQRPTW